MLFRLLGFCGLAVVALSSVAAAEEVRARGVNPADNDTRVDLILKYNWLRGGAGIFTTTLKFDYRISPELGFNIEFPVLAHFHAPASFPGGSRHDTGVGDVFMRLRYVMPLGAGPFGHISVGGGLETVLPTASTATLGMGTYQLNLSGLVVQAWTPTVITAFVGKAVQSVHAFNGRASVQENTLRVVQAFILPRGMFVTLDGRYNWETVNRRDVWWEGQVELGMMFDARTAGSVAFARKWGDRQDRGAVTLGFKRFF